jgi:prepilin-type N-terminal cleavage/methylation domain-containing protein
MFKQSTKNGFTLVELLVVIAIIGLLSSVVFASLKSARLKARDAAVKQMVRQFGDLMAMEYDASESYANLKKMSWGTACPTFAGNYATQAKTLCDAILVQTGASNGRSGTDPTSGNVLYISTQSSDSTQNQKFSIMAFLPSTSDSSGGKFFCLSHNGLTDGTPYSIWNVSGCYSDPKQ